MKLFSTNNMGTVRHCQHFFNFELPSVTVTNRAARFKSLFHVNSSNLLQSWQTAAHFVG